MGKNIIYEDVLQYVGEFGVYQLCIYIYACGIAFISVESIYMNFIGYRMDHWCAVPELVDLPYDVQKNVAIPYASNSTDDYEQCEMFSMNYSLYSDDQFLNWNRQNGYETEECSGWVYDQSVYAENIINEWDLVCSKNWQVDLISTLTLTGFLFGSIIGGMVSDRFGRVKAMSMGLVIKVFGSVLSTVAPNYATLAAAKFIMGLGSMQTYIVTFVLFMENVGNKHRSWMGIVYSIFFSLGFSIVPLYALACQNWRDLQIVMTAPVFVFLATVWFLPESPRWLVSKGKFESADKAIHQMAKVNNRHLPDDFNAADIQLEGSGEEDSNKKTVLDLFKTPKIRRYTIIQYIIWFSVNLIYYALSLNAGTLAGDVYLNTALLGLVEIPACLICFVAMGTKFLGRRRTVAWASILGGIASLICVPIIIVDEDSIGVTVLAMVGKAGASAAFNGIYVFTSEIYPTEVRNVGLGSCSMVARISGIAAPYIGGFLGDVWGPMPSLIFGVAGTISGFITFFLPETYGKTLPDTVAELESGTIQDSNTMQFEQETETEDPSSQEIYEHIKESNEKTFYANLQYDNPSFQSEQL